MKQSLLSPARLWLLVSLFLCTGCVSRPPAEDKEESAFQERVRLLSQQVAGQYQPVDYTDRGKYSFPVVIARMRLHGPADARAAAYLGEYASGKYGFFHFPFVGLARILCLYPEAPAVEANREAFLREILFHDPLYHYNALTGEGTENHVSMSRTSGYLFAQEALRYPDLRERAVVWQATLREWILGWSKRLYQYGNGEWDSSPYTPYNLVGWLNLFDFAADPDVRMAARAVLDYHAANIALKWTQGILGGPESRGSGGYGSLPRTASDYLGWLWFGTAGQAAREGFFLRNEYIQAMHAATSRYRPPAALLPLARKEVPTPALFHNTKPDYLMLEQGESFETFLIEDSFTLGTVQTPHGGWINAAYGIINWKLVAMNPDGLPLVVSGNGGMKSLTHPRGRNPFDQFLQYKNTVVQMSRVPDNAEAIAEEVAGLFREWRAQARTDFEKRWGRRHILENTHLSDSERGDLATAGWSLLHLPDPVEVRMEGPRAWIRLPGTYLAAHTLSGQPPVLEAGKLIDRANREAVAGFVIEVVNARDFASFQAFVDATLALPPLEPDHHGTGFRAHTLHGDVLEFDYVTSGRWQEMIYDWGAGVTEQRVGFNTPDWYQADWPSGEGHGRIPRLRVNGTPVEAKPTDPILDGPFLHMDAGILSIETPAGRYRVDYAGDRPLFKGKAESAAPHNPSTPPDS